MPTPINQPVVNPANLPDGWVMGLRERIKARLKRKQKKRVQMFAAVGDNRDERKQFTPKSRAGTYTVGCLGCGGRLVNKGRDQLCPKCRTYNQKYGIPKDAYLDRDLSEGDPDSKFASPKPDPNGPNSCIRCGGFSNPNEVLCDTCRKTSKMLRPPPKDKHPEEVDKYLNSKLSPVQYRKGLSNFATCLDSDCQIASEGANRASERAHALSKSTQHNFIKTPDGTKSAYTTSRRAHQIAHRAHVRAATLASAAGDPPKALEHIEKSREHEKYFLAGVPKSSLTPTNPAKPLDTSPTTGTASKKAFASESAWQNRPLNYKGVRKHYDKLVFKHGVDKADAIIESALLKRKLHVKGNGRYRNFASFNPDNASMYAGVYPSQAKAFAANEVDHSKAAGEASTRAYRLGTIDAHRKAAKMNDHAASVATNKLAKQRHRYEADKHYQTLSRLFDEESRGKSFSSNQSKHTAATKLMKPDHPYEQRKDDYLNDPSIKSRNIALAKEHYAKYKAGDRKKSYHRSLAIAFSRASRGASGVRQNMADLHSNFAAPRGPRSANAPSFDDAHNKSVRAKKLSTMAQQSGKPVGSIEHYKAYLANTSASRAHAKIYSSLKGKGERDPQRSQMIQHHKAMSDKHSALARKHATWKY